MGAIDLPKSPNIFHPEKPSAVGSRNSLAQEFRNQQEEVDLLLSEEVDKVMNHVSSKLPKETLSRMDIMGGLKEKLFNYYNQHYQKTDCNEATYIHTCNQKLRALSIHNIQTRWLLLLNVE